MSGIGLLEEIYSVDTTLVVGDNGVGKTLFCMHHPETKRGVYIDMEGRYTRRHMEANGVDWITRVDSIDKLNGGTVIDARVLDDKYKINYIKTFDNLNKIVNHVIYNVKPRLIVVDNIVDLRRMADDKHASEKEKEKKREVIESYWGEVNKLVKDIVFPLINYTMLNETYLIFTTLWEPEYQRNQIVGEKIGAKEYITSSVNQIICLDRKGTQFFIERGKSFYPPTEPIEITGVWKEWRKLKIKSIEEQNIVESG